MFQHRTAGDVGGSMIPVAFEFGSGSGKTERGPLMVPGERRLMPIEGRLGDVRGEIPEADDPGEIGSALPA
jgi:hypothetical protein